MTLRKTALAGLALALAALAPPTASAATADRQPGAIAFTGSGAGTQVIYTSQANGRGLRSLAQLGRTADPAFSPLGRRLAFTRYTPGGAQLWVTYLDGTGVRQVTPGPSDGMAAWAPTGEQLAFARGPRGRRDIYRVFADGSTQRRLTLYRADDHSPSWSVTNRVAFIRRLGRKEVLYSVSASGGTARRLSRGKDPDAYPAWSPTGKTLVVSRGRAGRRDLYLVRADGSRARRLTRVPGDETKSAWSPDGSRIVFAYRRGRSRRLFVIRLPRRPLTKLPSRGRTVRAITSSRLQAASPDWQLTGADPVVAAAGDIACDPGYVYFNRGEGVPGACRQKLASDLLLRLDLSSILILGDIQYEDGKLWKFQQSFHPSWGRMKHLMRPVPGNHEYQDEGAAGYFDYFNGPGQFNGPAGARDKGYYSFDLGAWHVIALNSECRWIGGCGPGSSQEQWLRADLAANPRQCTLAYWHRPRYTSGRHNAQGDVLTLWRVLYAARADLILNGHEHFYERFAPQSPDGGPDPAAGIRQITAGMGGRSHHGFVTTAPNSEARDNLTTGVLKLTLREGAYDWELLRAPSGRADRGSDVCR